MVDRLNHKQLNARMKNQNHPRQEQSKETVKNKYGRTREDHKLETKTTDVAHLTVQDNTTALIKKYKRTVETEDTTKRCDDYRNVCNTLETKYRQAKKPFEISTTTRYNQQKCLIIENNSSKNFPVNF